ncbi:MAG: hypothetical protein KC503_21940 [Myxococcales bacterium]|nr:hypothetical protein [Myxococcales bacterium]
MPRRPSSLSACGALLVALLGASCSDSAPPPPDSTVDAPDASTPDTLVDFGIPDLVPTPDTPPPPPGPWREVPAFTKADLIEASVIARDDIWIVGAGGEIWHFDGTTYRKASSPVGATARLFTVACLARGDCWAAGREGSGPSSKMVLLRYDGSAWTLVPSNADETFTCIRVVGSDYYATTGESRALVRWDGSAWQPQWRDPSGAVNTFCLGGISPDALFVSGSQLVQENGGTVTRPFALRRAGAGFSPIALPSPGPELPQLSQASALLAPWVLSADEAWLPMGRMALVHYVQGKLSETLLPGASQGGSTTMMWGFAADDIWLIGRFNGPSSVESRIFHYDGSAWTPHEVVFDRAPLGIIGKRGQTAIIVGEDGLVLRYAP